MSIVLGIEGDDKTGKTTLALTAPKPIFHADLDVGGYRRASHRFKELEAAGQLVSKPYYLPQQGILEQLRAGGNLKPGERPQNVLKPSRRLVGMKELWYDLLTDYANVLDGRLTNPSGQAFQTFIFDPFPQVWELCQAGFLQEKQERQAPNDKVRESLLQIEFGEPNARMRSLVYAARQMDKNLILPHYMKELYGEKLIDGQVKQVIVGSQHAGWKYLDKESDLVIRTRSQMRGSGIEFWGMVRISGVAAELTGTDLQNPKWDDFDARIRMYRGE